MIKFLICKILNIIFLKIKYLIRKINLKISYFLNRPVYIIILILVVYVSIIFLAFSKTIKA